MWRRMRTSQKNLKHAWHKHINLCFYKRRFLLTVSRAMKMAPILGSLGCLKYICCCVQILWNLRHRNMIKHRVWSSFCILLCLLECWVGKGGPERKLQSRRNFFLKNTKKKKDTLKKSSRSISSRFDRPIFSIGHLVFRALVRSSKLCMRLYSLRLVKKVQFRFPKSCEKINKIQLTHV